MAPTGLPSSAPSPHPTQTPTGSPSAMPTQMPTITDVPDPQCQQPHLSLIGDLEDVLQGPGTQCDQQPRHGWAPGNWTSFGDRMIPTTDPGSANCGAMSAGWMQGTVPAISDGLVTRTLCYSWAAGGQHWSCRWSSQIQVVNCGSMYLYRIPPSAGCDLGFCTTLAAGLWAAADGSRRQAGEPSGISSSAPSNVPSQAKVQLLSPHTSQQWPPCSLAAAKSCIR